MARRKQKRSKAVRARPKAKPVPAAEKKTLVQRILRAIPLVVLAVVFTFILSRTGAFAELETTILDTQMRLDMPETESPVVIVDIGQEDFDTIFGGKTRPLDPAGLKQLTDAVAAGAPCAVAVDIDTSFDQFSEFVMSDTMANFIWSRSTIESSGSEKPQPLRVLGRDDDVLYGHSGLPPLGDNDKRITRYYARAIETTLGPLPSLGWRVFEEARDRKCPNISFPQIKQESGSFVIGFSRGSEGRGRIKIPAKNILTMAASSGWASNELIRDKIVVIGGSYLGEDRYDTPIGVLTGAEIHANVIETELRGGGIKPPGLATIILLQIFDGFLLLGLYQVFSWRKAALLSIPLILVFSLACSFVTYYSFSYWLFFLPVMLAVALTQIFDEVKDYFKGRYKREIKEGYQTVTGRAPEE